jgi:glycosyltransferase involved in cell wall biosynthesis
MADYMPKLLKNGNRIRVMRIIARLNIGGPSFHVVNLNTGLDRARYDSLLVTGMEEPHEGTLKDMAAARGVHLEVIPELGRGIHWREDMVTIGKLFKLMRRYRPHIVHTHTAKAGFVGRIAARLAGVPVVCHTFHGHVLKGYFGPLKTGLFIQLEKLGALLSDRVITLTEGLRDEIISLGISRPDHFGVIPLGFDLSPFARQSRHQGGFRRELGITDKERLVGAVGRLTQIKNLPLLLKAMQRIHRIDPHVHLALVGDGELRQELEDYVDRLGLLPVVHFTGWRSDLPTIYSDLDVVVISSDNEGTPVSLIEAMAAGCPVVATRVGGVGELIADGQTGRLVPPGKVEPLAQSLLRTFQEPQKTRIMARKAQKLILARYHLDRLLKDVDNLYHQLLLEKGIE